MQRIQIEDESHEMCTWCFFWEVSRVPGHVRRNQSRPRQDQSNYHHASSTYCERSSELYGQGKLHLTFDPWTNSAHCFIYSSTEEWSKFCMDDCPKKCISKDPEDTIITHVMKSTVQGRPLILYTASSDVVIGDFLAQEDEEGVQHPIYYFNRTMRDAELRHPKSERACLAFVHAIQKFRHYLMSNRVVLVAKVDPGKFLLSKPSLIGRPAKWLLHMSEFDIACVSPKEIKGQEVADLLVAFPGEDITMLHEDVPGEFPEISVIKEETWLLYFDGSATPSNDTGGAGVVLVSPSGEVFSHSFKLDFHCTNNSAEYEAFLLGLSLAKQAGAMHLEIRGDSKLLVNQMNGAYSLKEVTLSPFRVEAQCILAYFSEATIVHTGRTNNRHADCLATLASKLQFEGPEKSITV
ncbi:uncharacterized protein LOC113272386 [Papaver somniferum]|uniref:uncharacterized protein LOC113272386 n=1 Tax=Papaver somniferum TaxID=3469 RepID=UPI000E6F90DE|nr:uncharacterized protein LOC113272386 [Papaver somniferum]